MDVLGVVYSKILSLEWLPRLATLPLAVGEGSHWPSGRLAKPLHCAQPLLLFDGRSPCRNRPILRLCDKSGDILTYLGTVTKDRLWAEEAAQTPLGALTASLRMLVRLSQGDVCMQWIATL